LSKCPICKNTSANIVKSTTHEKGNPFKQVICYSGDCPTCGNYFVNDDIVDLEMQQKNIPSYIISSMLRNLYESNKNLVIYSFEQLKELVVNPKSPIEKIELLLAYLFRKQEKMNVGVPINTTVDYSLIFAHDKEEFEYFILQAKKMGYVDSYGFTTLPEFRNMNKLVEVIGNSELDIFLTLQGWKKASELVNQSRISNRAFVAMWFKEEDQKIDNSHDKLFTQGIKPALINCGYEEPFRSIEDLHNDKIPDRIIAQIKKSSLVVADLTGNRQCVYYEAGFAQGFGIPVIFTCNKNDEKKLKQVGFDISPYKIIFWNKYDELKVNLESRIKATIQ
jgi:hypothetical protein